MTVNSAIKMTTTLYHRDDLLHPGAEVKSKPEILSDNTKVDPRPLYKTSCKCIPKEMTVRQLKEALLDKDVDKDEDSSQLCLDLSQRDAIYKALLHPLTVIQVYLSHVYYSLYEV